jgi:hypothetical protein
VNEYSSFAIFLYFLVFVFGCHMQKLAFKETLYTTSLSRAMKFGREKKKRDW